MTPTDALLADVRGRLDQVDRFQRNYLGSFCRPVVDNSEAAALLAEIDRLRQSHRPQETRAMPDDTVPQPPRHGGPDDPAYPLIVPDGADCDGAGLTIRQWFAACALARLAGQYPDQLGIGGTAALSGAERCARACREHADALLRELGECPPAARPGAG